MSQEKVDRYKEQKKNRKKIFVSLEKVFIFALRKRDMSS